MSTEFPLVTIITPSFNQGKFIEATINSVLAQTYKNIEYIVLDAMSTDETVEVLARLGPQISLVVRERDRGQSDAICKGFSKASGELIGWINSDDILYPKCVEDLVSSYLKNRDAVLFVPASVDVISEDGINLFKAEFRIFNRDHLLRKCNTLIQQGAFFGKSALEAVGYIDRSLKYSMDLDLWLRLMRIGEFVEYSLQPVGAYREWGGTKTSTGGLALLAERKKLLLHHGANKFDASVNGIRFDIFKEKLKTTPIIGNCIRYVLSFFKRAA